MFVLILIAALVMSGCDEQEPQRQSSAPKIEQPKHWKVVENPRHWGYKYMDEMCYKGVTYLTASGNGISVLLDTEGKVVLCDY